MSKTIKRLLVVLVGVLFATTAYAQSTTAAIAGHVTDEHGALTDVMITAAIDRCYDYGCVYTVGHRLSCLL